MRLSFPRLVTALLAALTVVSCASSFELSPNEEAQLKEAMDTPLSFVVPRGQSISTWDRAQEFIDRYSSMKLRSVNDSLITSYENTPMVTNPIQSASNVRFGYTVSRANDPEGIRFHVQCTASGKSGETDADKNAHIAAYYIKTGTVACDRCIVR